MWCDLEVSEPVTSGEFPIEEIDPCNLGDDNLPTDGSAVPASRTDYPSVFSNLADAKRIVDRPIRPTVFVSEIADGDASYFNLIEKLPNAETASSRTQLLLPR